MKQRLAPERSPVDEKLNTSPLIQGFQTWANEISQQIDPVKGESQEGSVYVASEVIEKINLPDGIDWSPSIKDTKMGLLMSEELMKATLAILKGESYGQGHFVESGLLLVGQKASTGEIAHSLSMTAIPFPGSDRSGAHLNISPAVWASTYRILDELNSKYPKGVAGTAWVHDHPGNAFASQSDRNVQSNILGLPGLVIGNKLLNTEYPNLTPGGVRELIKNKQIFILNKGGNFNRDGKMEGSIAFYNDHLHSQMAGHYGHDPIDATGYPVEAKLEKSQADADEAPEVIIIDDEPETTDADLGIVFFDPDSIEPASKNVLKIEDNLLTTIDIKGSAISIYEIAGRIHVSGPGISMQLPEDISQENMISGTIMILELIYGL